MKKVLFIEDDKNLSSSLSEYLKQEGFHILQAGDLKEAIAGLQDSPEMIILDWMLPDGQGIDFLRELRRTEVNLPVLLLTSRVDLIDKVLGLETGANDYISKPFEPRELVARIRSQFRIKESFARHPQKTVQKIEVSGITLILESREVIFRGQKIDFTRMEFQLLKLFLENPLRVFPREALLNEVWGFDSYPTTRTVDNHVLQLRQKLTPSLFETVHGVGYRFRVIEK